LTLLPGVFLLRRRFTAQAQLATDPDRLT
jgi:hypothetical protein